LEQDLLIFEPAPPAHETSLPTTVSNSDENSEGFDWPANTGIQIIRATCAWIQYGTVGFAAFCIVIGALEGLLGR
jgi:hypothetical protein